MASMFYNATHSLIRIKQPRMPYKFTGFEYFEHCTENVIQLLGLAPHSTHDLERSDRNILQVSIGLAP